VVNQAEMKYKEFAEYHKYYCGLCKALKDRHGGKGQISLSNDMTFLVILLTGLYEPENTQGSRRCLAHPVTKHEYIINECTEYVADMNVVLTYYKCLDDWQDEKKLVRKIYADILMSKKNPVHERYEEKIKNIVHSLKEIHRLEEEAGDDIDRLAGAFGDIMAEICVMKQDEWKNELGRLGYYLGKFIYILDAYDDIEKDIKKGNFNPLISRLESTSHSVIMSEVKQNKWEELEDWCHEVLTMLAAECAKSFELLPIIQNVEILRNILYSGMWSTFYKISDRRRKTDE
jgi:hypothetical protein